MHADREAVAELLAAITYGERLAVRRLEDSVGLAPEPPVQKEQRHVAERERERLELLEARLREMDGLALEDRFAPFFDAFFEATVPTDWVEAQTFHYVGDALVSDLAEALLPTLDPVTAEVVRRAVGERDEQDAFALDQVTAALRDDPAETERIASYARTVVGEALTQTRRALDASEAVSSLLGEPEDQKRILLDLLDRHRRRLDRLGIEPVEPEP
ncbi:MAG TPA: ferritin-like fold-containing protein [Actinomycetota bacterium]